MKKLIAVCIAASISSAAYAGKDMIAVTPSGLPDMIFPATNASDVAGKLASDCMNRRMTVVSNLPTEVVCEIPMGVMKAAVVQAVIGNSYSTTPRQFVRFALVALNADVRTQGSAWVETQMALGQVRREPLQGDAMYNGLMNMMEGAGAQYLPGTSFPNQAFIGKALSNDQPTMYKGKPTLGITFMDLIVGGTLHNAGARLGDTLVSINGKPFQNYDEFYERLRRVAVGAPIRFVVIRDGKPVELSSVAQQRPSITDKGDGLVLLSQQQK